MSHLLLLGAGFSRNWGGWLASEVFEHLLGSPEVVRNSDLRRLLWKHQWHGGFEGALAELQAEYKSDQKNAHPSLEALQRAVSRVFKDMNEALASVIDWQFGQGDMNRKIGTFLTRFDAIFTLNQDLLLEHHYTNENISLTGVRTWAGAELPGMKRVPNQDPMRSQSWSHSTWTPFSDANLTPNPSFQPIYKLHGSSNWIRADGAPLLIMGGAKAREIGATPILNRYADEFERRLCSPNTRLMVIGYGFRDDHINGVIAKASSLGLKMFIVAPEGTELARRNNPTRVSGQISAPTSLEAIFQDSLIGASRRTLRETFGHDYAEYSKLIRFFEA